MSMERHVRAYILWILCVDDETYEVLGRLDLPNLRRLKLSDLETPELLEVKPKRTIAEYCWTLTPFAPKFVFEADSTIERVTYIDSDLWFLKHPKPIFDEFEISGKQVLITEHAYAPEYDQSAKSGQYCVQYMTFTRNGGEFVRKWWEDRCIEWCFAYFEDGRFGDQKYLEKFIEYFEHKVHVLKQKHLIIAPWNCAHYNYSSAVIYHFHGFRLVSPSKADLGNYIIPYIVKKYVYKAYLNDIKYALKSLKIKNLDIQYMKKETLIHCIKSRIIKIAKLIYPFISSRFIKF